MPSLVSNFIINPVLRQARRFSSGFATEEPPALRHHRTRSDGEAAPFAEDAILEVDGDVSGRILASRRSRTSSISIAQPPTPGPRTSSRRNTLDRAAPGEPGPASTEQSGQPRAQPRSPSSADVAARGLVWIDEASPNTPLPEDDGNGELRQKILAIQALVVSQTLKDQLVHQLLMEGYNNSKSRHAPPTSPTLGPESPTSRSVQDHRDAEPSGALQQALKFLNPLGDLAGPLDLPISEADRRRTYVPNAPPLDDDLGAHVEKMGIEDHGQPVLGCEHYRRNVKMQCATCEKWYTCRFCHDAVEDHALPRRDTKHMLCMLCGCAQKASDTCIGCGESAAYYFCGVCKLWNDDPNKSIYHCNDCGLCRVGQGLGKDFFHCKKCMACISMTTGHKCIERSIDCDCPICGEYMFNSPRPIIFMQCGHGIHRRCFDQHMQSSYKCPLCNKSCINMDAQFRNFDMAILTQPMPPEYRDARAIVSCNDCSAKSQTAYHWLGLKCSLCSSYNTIQQQLLHMPGQDFEPSSTAATRSQPGTMRIPSGRRLSELAAEALPDIAALARQLRRSARARDRAERVAGPSVLSRLFAPRDLARSVPSGLATGSASASAPAVISPIAAASSAAELLASGAGISTTLASSSNPGVVPAAASRGLERGLTRAGDTDDSEDEDGEDEDMLDFWGRSGDDTRGLTSDGGVDGDEEGEEEEESSSSSSEDGCDEDEDDEEEQIVLFGHR